jgi:hypothetical protein
MPTALKFVWLFKRTTYNTNREPNLTFVHHKFLANECLHFKTAIVFMNFMTIIERLAAA